MYQKTSTLFLYAMSPLHAGAGEGLTGIDLPIQREGQTKYPKIEASGIKGALKESFKLNDKEIKIAGEKMIVNESKNGAYSHISLVFGPEVGDENASAIGFSDGRLLLFPVASLKGTFAWVTCPMVLNQLLMDLNRMKPSANYAWEGMNLLCPKLNSGIAWVDKSNTNLKLGSNIFLNEFPMDCLDSETNQLHLTFQEGEDSKKMTLGTWLKEQKVIDNEYFLNKLTQDIAIISDDDFRDFVEMKTEVITRIRIDSATGIVEDGALFTEEYLPAQSLLYNLVSFAPVFLPTNKKQGMKIQTAEDVESFFKQGNRKYWQIGGNATLGKGMMHLQIID